MKYQVKCSTCKVTMRETEDIRESYAGGTCGHCKKEIAAQQATSARKHGGYWTKQYS